MKVCSIVDCDNSPCAKGMCNKHYLASRYANGYRPPNPSREEPEAARLRAKVWRQKNREIANAKRRDAYAANGDSVRERNRAWRAENISPEQERMRSVEFRKTHPEKRKAISARYGRKHAAAINARTAKRRAVKLSATPLWANQFFIQEIYDLAKRRTKVMGFKWHVDHIVPLRHPSVCGLHVEHNLQVIPAIKNLSKNNRWWPGMP